MVMRYGTSRPEPKAAIKQMKIVNVPYGSFSLVFNFDKKITRLVIIASLENVFYHTSF